MSVCFEVSSLLGSRDLAHPRFRNTHTREEWHRQRQEVLDAICRHFAWERIPWQEPSEQHGRYDLCCSWHTYDWLRALAAAIALNDSTSTVDALRRTRVAPFLHLTDRNDSQYTAIYLPAEFPEPFQIETSFYWEVCTIGSSYRLADELRQLAPLLKQEQGKQTKAVAHGTDEHWQYLHELCADLLSYAQESVEMQLPMLVTW